MKGIHLPKYLLIVALLIVVLGGVNIGLASQSDRVLMQDNIPTMVSYQGQVKVGGIPYSGTGYFKFAILTERGGTQWSNDGTSIDGEEPEEEIVLSVSGGFFNVLLGDTDIPNMTLPLHASVFEGSQRYLRTWFSSDNSTFVQLVPDQRIATVPYALQAEEAAYAENADQIDGYHAGSFQKHYQGYVVVALSGGDYTTISAALAAISASSSNRYLIKVMPGVYNEQVTMEPYVDIEGSGELNTKITYAGSSSIGASTGTLFGASNSELRWLTVENTGGSTHAIAINNWNNSPQLTHITAIASGGTYNYGIHNYESSTEMMNIKTQASGGTGSYGVYNNFSSATIRDSVLSGKYGIYNHVLETGGGYLVFVDRSQIIGTVNTIRTFVGFDVYVGASMLSGGVITYNMGDVYCYACYDENYYNSGAVDQCPGLLD